MSLTEKELITRARYNESAEEWLSFSGGRNRANYWDKELRELKNFLKDGSLILEVGCGPATDGVYMGDAGFDVVSFDYSRSMLQIAKDISPEALILEMDTKTLAFQSNIFDGFWASAVLLHLENPALALHEIRRVTKKGGYGFISVKEGEEEIIDPRTGYYFHYFRNEEFSRIIRENSFEIAISEKRPWKEHKNWLTYIVEAI